MSDIFRKWSPKDPLNGISSEFLNALQQMLKWYFRQRTMSKPGAMATPLEVSLSVQNDTGDSLDQFAIVKAFGDPVLVPLPADNFFFGKTIFKSAAPAVGEPFAVLQLPTLDQDLAPAIVAGETFCFVDITDVTHRYAAPSAGVYTNLTSQAEAGPARILWADTDGATQLDGAINNSVTTIVVDSTDGLEVGDTIIIGTEEMHITAVVDDVTLTVTRGYHGTTAASHADNSPVAFSAGVVWAYVLIDLNNAARTIIAHTDGTFVVPAVAATASVTITTAVDTSIWMVIGQTILVTDATHVVYGHITAIADATHFTLMTDRVAGGAAGNTMATDAKVIISGDPSQAFLRSLNDSTTPDQAIGLGIAGTDINLATVAVAWSSTQQYQAGWFVSKLGVTYRALAANIGDSPPSGNWIAESAHAFNIFNHPRLNILLPDTNTVTGDPNFAFTQTGNIAITKAGGSNKTANFNVPQITIATPSGTATGIPGFTFATVGGITIAASGSTITFAVAGADCDFCLPTGENCGDLAVWDGLGWVLFTSVGAKKGDVITFDPDVDGCLTWKHPKGGPVTCCNNAVLPGILYSAITNKLGDCVACLPDSAIVFSNAFNSWDPIVGCNTAEDGCVGDIALVCADPDDPDCEVCLTLTGTLIDTVTLIDCSLDPFSITFDVVSLDPGASFTITFVG